MPSMTLWESENDYPAARTHELRERRALRLAGAWCDFDTAEYAATEIVRRFGAIETNDHGVLRLHKQPTFIALQTASVISYTRPFSAGGLEKKYAVYGVPEWQDLHETLFVWKDRLTGELGSAFRQFLVVREQQGRDGGDCYVLGETTNVLSPQRHFALLREMCRDRKTLIWTHCQDAIAECRPGVREQVLLSLSARSIQP